MTQTHTKMMRTTICITLLRFLSVFDVVSSSNQAKIAIVGSGNWGTAVARRIAINRARLNNKTSNSETSLSDGNEVYMWVHEEVVDGRNLTDIINNDHVNCKYLPNVTLPTSIIAMKSLEETVKDADILLFVVPHQFISNVVKRLQGHVKPTAIAVSLIKGIQYVNSSIGDDCHIIQPTLISDFIKNELQLEKIAVLMGANVASDVATDCFVEATIASRDLSVAREVQALFDCSCFRTELTEDLPTVEYCGALKNIIALGAGLVDGLQLGSESSKAALIRKGTDHNTEGKGVVSRKDHQ
jgi:glycerol-3-phosphate dehydrogenase (NAD+)